MIREHKFLTTEPTSESIWIKKISDYQPINLEILNSILLHQKENPIGVIDDINVNVWQTDWHMEKHSGFSDIADIAKETASEIAKDFYRYNTFNPKIIDCWANVYNKDSLCHVHHHFPATFSLVYYVMVPKNSGDIYFPTLSQSFKPDEGTLICFRGDLVHGVSPGPIDNERIIVGINIINESI